LNFKRVPGKEKQKKHCPEKSPGNFGVEKRASIERSRESVEQKGHLYRKERLDVRRRWKGFHQKEDHPEVGGSKVETKALLGRGKGNPRNYLPKEGEGRFVV